MLQAKTDIHEPNLQAMTMPTDLTAINDLLHEFDPLRYSITRNYSDGGVSRLSPYISRGVITFSQVVEHLLQRGFDIEKLTPFLQELAWREYFQHVWNREGKGIDRELYREQEGAIHDGVPEAILNGSTGIHIIDKALTELQQDGYLHNHLRMYIAAISCHTARCHWYEPARWMYYHLLDGDWASNALSWQWVAGTNSSKRYVANQENINRFTKTFQKNTFLDRPYELLLDGPVPHMLEQVIQPDLETPTPLTKQLNIDESLPVLLYTSYNLDPEWHQGSVANRVLILEPDHFRQYPVSGRVMNFIIALSKNIEGLQVFWGNFIALREQFPNARFHFKQHPFNGHFVGMEEPRERLFEVEGNFKSFFKFWKACQPTLKRLQYDFVKKT